MDNLSSGLPWVVIFVAIAVLGAVMVYGSLRWRSRRLSSRQGPARAPGPASKADERLPDPRVTPPDSQN